MTQADHGERKKEKAALPNRRDAAPGRATLPPGSVLACVHTEQRRRLPPPGTLSFFHPRGLAAPARRATHAPSVTPAPLPRDSLSQDVPSPERNSAPPGPDSPRAVRHPNPPERGRVGSGTLHPARTAAPAEADRARGEADPRAAPGFPTENLRANEKRKRPYREPKARWPSRAAAAASERRRRGGAGRQGCGPGGRGGLGAARSAGPSPPLALRRAALGGADWALWRRGGEAEAGAVGAKEEEKGEGLGPGRGGPPLACALAFPEEAGSSSAAAAAAVNGVMWIRGGTEQLLSQRIYRIRSQLIGSAGLHSLTLQRPPALRAAGGIQKGNCAAPRVPRLVLPPGRRHAGCPRGRAGHGGVSLSSFKETLTLRFPQGP
ncbi:atherin-like [Sagmatias obliquidens]|uniref:atherin-like n=1 Tax=Sagmatias obliquidens TaxID=3371155 RepID=UPI000F441A1A|nr:atherin-like [Lagenorhynchus obliquidens]XP_030712498.1 atherin-like [Globicephala melas]